MHTATLAAFADSALIVISALTVHLVSVS